MMIILKAQSEWKRDISYDELADEIMKKLEIIPGYFLRKANPYKCDLTNL
jgi:cobalt-zinc-cadmium resistance protein CzcA